MHARKNTARRNCLFVCSAFVCLFVVVKERVGAVIIVRPSWRTYFKMKS